MFDKILKATMEFISSYIAPVLILKIALVCTIIAVILEVFLGPNMFSAIVVPLSVVVMLMVEILYTLDP